MATFSEFSWLVDYASSTAPEAAARNNNKSGHLVIMYAFSGSGEYITDEEEQILKPWFSAFVRELRSIHGVGYVSTLIREA